MATNAEYTALEKARFERKFVIENKGAAYAEQLIKFNPGAFRSIYYKRQVNNIYFDSHNLNNYYDNHFGKSQRTKIRIRWYGDTFGEIKSPILEFKLKYGAAGKKKSFPLKSFTLDKNFNQQVWKELFETSDLPELVRNELKNQVPTLVNSYERKYFQSFDTIFRFTLDFNLKFYNIRSTNNAFIEQSLKNETVILELKYDVRDNHKVKNITANLPTRLNKFSKYVTGVELFNAHLAV